MNKSEDGRHTRARHQVLAAVVAGEVWKDVNGAFRSYRDDLSPQALRTAMDWLLTEHYVIDTAPGRTAYPTDRGRDLLGMWGGNPFEPGTKLSGR